MDSSGPILEATNLRKHYGATIALDDVSLSLYRGELCGLLGENGAGKSTLIKILSGIVVPDAGEILVEGASYRPRDMRIRHRAPDFESPGGGRRDRLVQERTNSTLYGAYRNQLLTIMNGSDASVIEF